MKGKVKCSIGNNEWDILMSECLMSVIDVICDSRLKVVVTLDGHWSSFKACLIANESFSLQLDATFLFVMFPLVIMIIMV